MSRIGKQSITLPDGVTATVENQIVKVTGPKGELGYVVHPDVEVKLCDNQLTCSVARSGKRAAALWGTTRSRLANIVEGVNEGYRKELELHGVGYRAKLAGKNLELSVGFSHPVVIEAPEGINFAVEKETITVEGYDKVQVGQMAANIRAVRRPEPYKGKGIRYHGEKVRRKVGKMVGTTE
ncbi:MAG: 50S ribosomal protein L6 [bacterium]